MFVHNFGALVTKDCLDKRFREFEIRIESAMDTAWEPLSLNVTALKI